MGFLWDMLQQNELTRRRMATESVEDRVAALEEELQQTKDVQRRLVTWIEENFNRDIDGDGKVG